MSSWESLFQAKKVLVTGAGRGIGRNITKKLFESGAIIYALGRNLENLASLQNECPNIHTIAVDLTEWAGTKRAIEKSGPFDCLVNCAAIAISEEFLRMKPESLDKIFNTNLKSMINVSQVVAQGMIGAGKKGSIVNVSTISSSKDTNPGFGAYASSKAALSSMTKTMAVDLGIHQIRVNEVNPTVIPSKNNSEIKDWNQQENELQQQLKDNLDERSENLKNIDQDQDLGLSSESETSEEVVSTVLFLLSDMAVSITGQNFVVS